MLLGEYPEYNTREFSTINEAMPENTNGLVIPLKAGIISKINRTISLIDRASHWDTSKPKAYYSSLNRLLLAFKGEVEAAALPSPLPEWWSYALNVDFEGVSLELLHYDTFTTSMDGKLLSLHGSTKYKLLCVNARLLSV